MSKQAHEEMVEIDPVSNPQPSCLTADRLETGDYYRTIFENNGTATLIVDKDLKISRVNSKVEALSGYSPPELVGRSPFEFMFPDDLHIAMGNNLLRRQDPESAPTQYEVRCFNKNGEVRDCILYVSHIPPSDYLVVSLLDISAQHRAEEALAHQIASQALSLEISKNFNTLVSTDIDQVINTTLRLITTFDHSDRGYVFLLSVDGTTMSNTHEWCAVGVRPEIGNLQDIPVNSVPWWIDNLRHQDYIYVPRVEDLPLPAAAAEKDILAAQSIQSLLIVPMRLDDKIIGFVGFDSVGKEKTWSQENILILESVAQNITQGLQRKQSLLDLQASENYYRTIFENTGAVTLILEEDMSIAMVNEECRSLLGYSQEDLAGRNWIEFIPAAWVEQIQAYHQRMLADPAQAPRKYPAQVIDQQGRIRDGLFMVALIPGTTSSVTTFIDLTDYKRMDRALKAISAVNAAMIRAESENELLQAVCQLMVEIGGYSLAWVGYLPDDPHLKLAPLAFAGRDHGYLAKLNIYLNDPRRGQGPTAVAIRSGRPVVTRNFIDAARFKPWSKDALRRGFKACIDIPLLSGQQAFGVLSIYSDESTSFDLEEQHLLSEMSNNLVYAISALRARDERNQATRQLQISLEKMHRLLNQSVTSLGTALHIRDPYTAGHQRKVVHLATAIAEELGFGADQIEGVSVAGNLHDIGKINVPSEILSKPGKLTDLEFEMIKTHCQAGYEIIKEIEFPWPVAEVLLQHHERLDGSGYPRGLAGDEILIEARIMAVADVVEAMASHRPYRPAQGIEKALEEITIHKGSLYDPAVVDACLKIFRAKGFHLE